MRTNLKPLKPKTKNHFPSYVIDVKVPEGMLYVFILEDNNEKIIHISALIGKTGSITNAWAAGVCELITNLVAEQGVPLDKIIPALSNSKSSQVVFNGSVPVHSGLDGIAKALSKYKDIKYQEFIDENDPHTSRRMVRRIG